MEIFRKTSLFLVLFLAFIFNVNSQTMLRLGQIDTIWQTGRVPLGLNNSNTWYTLYNRGGSSTKYVDTIYVHYDTLFWRKNGIVNKTRIDTFTSNPTILGMPTGYFGKYANGATPLWSGLSTREALLDAIRNCTHPTYVSPTAGVSSSPSNGSYEYGTNLGVITLLSTYTQNNGGTATATTYYANATPLTSNTFTITSLSSQQSAYVNKAYGQGACINDNCGNIDCTGRITAGSVNSSSIYFTPFYYRYWGWVNSNTPSDGTVQGLNKDAGGLSLTVTNTTPTGSQYYVYYHSISLGSITNITVNGFPSTSAFTITTVTFVNAQGYSSSYQKIVSNNALSATTSIVFN